MAEGEVKTKDNTALTVVVAANYGGHWDMCQAFRTVAEKMAAGELKNQVISEQLINQHLSTAGLPDPDCLSEQVANNVLAILCYGISL